jgi:hypothetical protein
MDHDIATLLMAKSKACDLLLRYFYTLIAMRETDPKKWIFESIETLIGSTDNVEKRPSSRDEEALWDLLHAELREFARNVTSRFNDDGTLKMRGRLS